MLKKDDTCCKSEDTLVKKHAFEETPLVGSCENIVVKVLDNLVLVEHGSLDPLYLIHAFLSCSPPSPSSKCYIVTPIN